jgi:hypothetical protein
MFAYVEMSFSGVYIFAPKTIFIPDPGARKLRNFSGKMHFLVI